MRALFVLLLVAVCATATFARAVEESEIIPTELIQEEEFDVEETPYDVEELLDDFIIEELAPEEDLQEDEDEGDNEEYKIRISKAWFKRLLNRLKGKIVNLYKKACERKQGHDVCKKWARENINKKNLDKFWREVKPLIKDYCSASPHPLCIAVRILM
uniref:Venom polypeptide n=1 Tax=Dolopus genitalis TaxID=2488630 RepID=A0A3G5BIM2_DOLGE|nr:venom polypeptide [Dolopus genitalis]